MQAMADLSGVGMTGLADPAEIIDCLGLLPFLDLAMNCPSAA